MLSLILDLDRALLLIEIHSVDCIVVWDAIVDDVVGL